MSDKTDGGARGGADIPRVYAYVDGFNLYHVLNKHHKKCKWLDLRAAVKKALDSSRVPGSVEKVKLFAGRATSDMGEGKGKRQATYFAALRQHVGEDRFQHIGGEFAKRDEDGVLADGEGAGQRRRFSLWREKRTDVNLAVHMLDDAWKDRYEIAVFISADTDFISLLHFVHGERKKKIFLVHAEGARVPRELLRQCEGGRPLLLSQEQLLDCQMDDEVRIPNSNQTISRPKRWR